MFLIRGSLPASSFEGFRVAESLIGLGRIYPWCREHKNMETFQPTTGIIWMNSMWPTVKQFLCFKWVLNVFFLLFCLVWNLAAWAAPSLSALRSARVLCVCVSVWLRDSEWLSWCESVSVCHAVRRRSTVWKLQDQGNLCKFDLSNWEQHSSSGKSGKTTLMPSVATIKWKSSLCDEFLWFDLQPHWTSL